MSYTEKATTLEENVEEINGIIKKLKEEKLDSVWTGDTSLTLNSEFNTNVERLETEVNKLSKFASTLRDAQTYKDNKEKITSLRRTVGSIPYTMENLDRIKQLNSEIRTLSSSTVTLRTKIYTSLASFGSITSANDERAYVPAGQVVYTVDPDELIRLYNPGEDLGVGTGLKPIGPNVSIYDLYNRYDDSGVLIEGSGRDYVEGMIQQVQCDYTGRDAAVNCALTMLKLASDKNVRIDYEHKGTSVAEPYVPTAEIASGVDSNPFASWVIDKGTPGGFQWRPISEYTNLGAPISVENWSTAQPGDVFVSDGHVGIIILNDPENNLFLTAESSNGIEIRTRTYSQLQAGNYQVRDLTSVYDGAEDTNREAFNGYVNWSTYERQI